ncbi:PepSY-associated TM helix domain-containing protein [Marinicella rhabdoformis]|uniref:PepSY-associated TM helix domain-containing protein n=1 Tax=Marinicella rhabdoformis TaxID=2580566 RepID=UPI0012AED774|nr:PepSY-associated TM helix domain-containing protein [Marinicella rhabdoformis]
MNLIKKLTPSKHLVKQSLQGHAWMGLFWAGLLYLICLSGTLVVFFPEMERWEQPLEAEYTEMSAPAISQALTAFQQKIDEPIESLYYIYPSEDIPRAHVSANDQEWWLNKAGDLTEAVDAPWTSMMTDLHIYLHLPHTIGIIIVGMLGAMMCGLVISGVLSHPNLFKDAFKMRWGGNKHLEQTDLHNRLSVWSLPFFLVISLTGAYIGLFGVNMTVADYFDESITSEEVISTVFGDDPLIDEAPTVVSIQTIQDDLKEREPQAEFLYLVVQKPGTDGQYVEMAATLPNRLIYSEIYRYHSDGRFIDYQHLSDGDAGRQIAYSSYRIHFGHFGGVFTKIMYVLLGFAMTAITVTGVNMWFNKRKMRNHWYYLWNGYVWTTPMSIALSAMCSMVFGLNPVYTFWISLVILSAVALRYQDENKHKNYLQLLRWLTVGLTVMTVFIHGINFPYEKWYWIFSGSIILLSILPVLNLRLWTYKWATA